MRKWLLGCLFLVGLMFAILNFSGLAKQGEFDSLIIDFKENIPTTEVSQELADIKLKYEHQPNLNSIFSIKDRTYIVKGDRKLLKKLRHSPLIKDVEYIEPNYQYRKFDTPNDPYYSKQWNFRSINVESAWRETKGSGIVVAVIDTGVSKVPDLKLTEFVKGYDFVADRDRADDDNGHGTHVAGTIAQSTNNNYGTAGIAYEAKIMPLKVLSEGGGGTVSDIAEAIKYAADNGADVINMSLGGGGESKMMQEAINYAIQKKVVVVAAAGNANQNAASYPARYPNVISVSATDSTGAKADYSNYGAGVDIAAPGGSETGKILQNTINPKTGESVFEGFQGTSMAAPHVAAVAALVKASGVEEPAEVLQVLKQSARKVAEDNKNFYGAGHLDAGAAVTLALKGKITVNDFFRWLRDSGYLNPGFWIDGGAIAVLPKLGMVVGSYLLAWFLKSYLPFTLSLHGGLIFGSAGLFALQGLYLFDLPQWPFRLFGSSLPELGNVVFGTSSFNPIFASVLIPFLLIALLASHRTWKWFAIGTCVGTAACLGISAIIDPAVWGLGQQAIARGFLGVNAVLCFALAYLASQGERSREV